MATRTRPELTSFPRAVARLVVFDVRRFRALAAVVLALEILRGVLVEWVGASSGALGLSRADVFEAERVTVPLVTAGVNAVVTAILVLADRPDDDRAFWRTRPIAPARFALAKAATLGVLLVGLPALVTAARLAWHHAPVAAMGAAAVQMAIVAGQVAGPAWYLAIVTRRLVLFVPAAILAALAYLATGTALLRASVNPAFGEGAVGAGGLDDVLWSHLQVLDWQREDLHGWPIAALFGVAGVVLLVWHDRHRRLAVTSAGMVLLLVAPRLWPSGAMDTAPDAALRHRLAGRVGAPLELRTRTPAYYDRTGPWETVALTGRLGLPTLGWPGTPSSAASPLPSVRRSRPIGIGSRSSWVAACRRPWRAIPRRRSAWCSSRRCGRRAIATCGSCSRTGSASKRSSPNGGGAMGTNTCSPRFCRVRPGPAAGGGSPSDRGSV